MEHTSELSRVVPLALFKKAFEAFMEQADQNAITGKSYGSKTPFGYSKKPPCDGADLAQRFGQGAASMAPYMNWWVVSIYYLPANGKILIGIEENRYPHLMELEIRPIRRAQIGNKKIKTLVYYSTTKESIDYSELYENFLCVCEEVMRIGLR